MPAISAPDDPLSPERRRFLVLITGAAAAVIGALVATPVVAFVLGPIIRHTPDVWRDVGAISDFEAGRTVHVTFEDPSPLPWAGVAGEQAAWLRRSGDTAFIAFSINCTHLGCPVRWVDTARLFMCPCHGGVFYEDGSVATGPPKQALARHEVRVREGRVEVRTRAIEITGKTLSMGS